MSPTTSSTRWCPTPEQVMILEEMYKGGMRTPNAAQIQQITAHLSYYGKIEGKNVFYWFQNHKARDRQKLRKKLSKPPQPPPPPPPPQIQIPPPPPQPASYYYYYGNNLIFDYLRAPPTPTSLLFNGPAAALNNTTFLNPHQGTTANLGGMEIAASRQMNMKSCCMCKLNGDGDIGINHEGHHDVLEMRMGRTTSYGGDDDVLMGPGSSSFMSSSNRPPLKTLQLFPITSTGFKESAKTSSSSSPSTSSSFSSSSNNLS